VTADGELRLALQQMSRDLGGQTIFITADLTKTEEQKKLAENAAH
jgi:hypothetical protein